MAQPNAPFLVVDDESESAARCQSVLSRLAPAELASTSMAARSLDGASPRWTALVIGAGVAPAASLELLSLAHAQDRGLPALVISRASEPAFRDDVRGRGGAYVRAPGDEAALLAFGERSLDAWLPRHAWIADALAHFARSQALSARELSVLRAAVAGATRERAANEFGISLHTYKSHVHALLRKCRAASLDDLALQVLRALLLAGPRPDAASAPSALTTTPTASAALTGESAIG